MDLIRLFLKAGHFNYSNVIDHSKAMFLIFLFKNKCFNILSIKCIKIMDPDQFTPLAV